MNVVEYLSHAGLKLERLLAFIESKNQTLKDNQAFIVSLKSLIVKRNTLNNNNEDDIYKPPNWLGLNPKDHSFELSNEVDKQQYKDMPADLEQLKNFQKYASEIRSVVIADEDNEVKKKKKRLAEIEALQSKKNRFNSKIPYKVPERPIIIK